MFPHVPWYCIYIPAGDRDYNGTRKVCAKNFLCEKKSTQKSPKVRFEGISIKSATKYSIESRI